MSILVNAFEKSRDISDLGDTIEKEKILYKENRLKDKESILRFVDIINFLKTDCIELFPTKEEDILDITSFLEDDILFIIDEYKQKNVSVYKGVLKEIHVQIVFTFAYLGMQMDGVKFDRSFKIWLLNKRKK